MIYQIVGIVCASLFSTLALYGAIRKDLATAIADAKNANDMATRAHMRIDTLMERVKNEHNN